MSSPTFKVTAVLEMCTKIISVSCDNPDFLLVHHHVVTTSESNLISVHIMLVITCQCS